MCYKGSSKVEQVSFISAFEYTQFVIKSKAPKGLYWLYAEDDGAKKVVLKMLEKGSIPQATTKPMGFSKAAYYFMDVVSGPKLTLYKCKEGFNIDWFAFLKDPYRLKK